MIINEKDNVEVNLENGHKYALSDIEKGEKIIKYGFPIGRATEDIKKGEHVHTHNMKTDLTGTLVAEYREYTPELPDDDGTFMGYLRENGEVGIRNEIWIIPTVGCVNGIAEALARKTGAKCYTHTWGCSQTGDDQDLTRKLLTALINHPNAGGVLVLGLGCENSNVDEIKKVLGSWNDKRVKFLVTQDCKDEIAEGVKLIEELKTYADTFKRTPLPVSKLKIGLKCGGSDGLSGITANPLVGKTAELFYKKGASILMTEVPEMFGGEQVLFDRCVSHKVFEDARSMVQDFRNYFTSHGESVAENPSPGNKAGGITTLEEKSLGCVQKGGQVPVVEALPMGECAGTDSGLHLISGPGNDIVAITNLTAAGAHVIYFTTGRGTPLGAPVPTIKVTTNNTIAERKPHWTDFNAGVLAEGADMESTAKELFDKTIKVAEGDETSSEKLGCQSISLFKSGVIL